MPDGKCVILFTEEMDLLADEDGTVFVFRNDMEARQYAERLGLSNFIVAGLLSGCIPDLSEGGPE